MATSTAAAKTSRVELVAFRHEALLYSGPEEFLAGTVPFLLEGIAAGDSTMVVLEPAKIAFLQEALGPDATAVRFANMNEVGSNPARIIPAWREFVIEHARSPRPLRGIGEPISPARTGAELVECQRHEALLNLAFDGVPAWWLLCPYDRKTLASKALIEAERSHPYVMESTSHRVSRRYQGLDAIAAPFARPLPDPPKDSIVVAFTAPELSAVRLFVAARADSFGLDARRSAELALAVNEIATNSLRHASGHGELRTWTQADSIIFEIRDDGHIDAPMIGHVRPDPAQRSGYGMWIANQLCDLVQVRSYPEGSAVRLHMRR